MCDNNPLSLIGCSVVWLIVIDWFCVYPYMDYVINYCGEYKTVKSWENELADKKIS